MPVIADKFGRYAVYMTTIICQLPIYYLSVTAPSVESYYIVSFLLGVALIGRFTSGFVLLLESACQRHKALTGTAMAIGDVAAYLYITLFLRYISNDIHTLIWIAFGFNVVSVIGSFWCRESPDWLVSVGEIERAK